MKATITSKGQITIPVRIRERLALRTGDVLEFDDCSPFLLARPRFDEKEMREALGCADNPVGLSSDVWLADSRGPVENPPEPQ